MDLGAILARVARFRVVVTVRSTLDIYDAAAGGLLANGLAFAALFATVPITLVTVGLAGRLAGDEAVQQAIVTALGAAFPPLKELIGRSLEALVQGAALTSIVGLVGTIWTVSRFYVALDVAFARIFGDEPRRTAWRQNLRAFTWVALLLGSVVAYIVVTSLVTTVRTVVPDQMPVAEALAAVLASPVMVFAIAIAAVSLVYRTLPPRTPEWSAVALPAAVVGVAAVALSQAFGFLAPRLVGVAAFVGPLAVVFIALAWLSAIFQVLLLGAAWLRVRVDARSAALRAPAATTEPGGRGE